MSLLSQINDPKDLQQLPASEMPAVAAELRQLIIETCASNGGHLAPSLGVVELTIALHRVFHSPEDKLIWDVGHQAYAHKILCGRRDSFIPCEPCTASAVFLNGASLNTMSGKWVIPPLPSQELPATPLPGTLPAVKTRWWR